MIRRDPFSPTFSTSQMLTRIQLLQVPPISLASKAGMWFEHVLSLVTHLRAKKCITVVETGHCFLLSLSISYTQKPEGTESEGGEILQGDPFSSFVQPVPTQLSLSDTLRAS